MMNHAAVYAGAKTALIFILVIAATELYTALIFTILLFVAKDVFAPLLCAGGILRSHLCEYFLGLPGKAKRTSAI
jgi:imidazole glycerol phosphate synthase subunit HisF